MNMRTRLGRPGPGCSAHTVITARHFQVELRHINGNGLEVLSSNNVSTLNIDQNNSGLPCYYLRQQSVRRQSLMFPARLWSGIVPAPRFRTTGNKFSRVVPAL